MLKEHETVARRAMIMLDALIVIATFFLTFALRRNLHFFYRIDIIPSSRVIAEMSASIRDYFFILVLLVPIWCFSLYSNGLYRSLRTRTPLYLIWLVIRSAVVTTLAFGTAVFLFKLEFVSRIFFIMFLAISSSSIALEKVAIFEFLRYFRKKGYNYRKILIVGTGRRAIDFIYKTEQHPEWGFRVVGLVDYENSQIGKILNGIKVLASLEEIPDILKQRSIDEVIFIVPRSQLGRIERYLYICETFGVSATVAVDLFDMQIAKLRQTELDGMPLITFETTPAQEWQLFIKRATDIVISGIGIVVLSPIFLLIAILIKLTSPGPVFYIQRRSGVNGRKFVLYKFRSMYKGAHVRLSELAGKNEMKGPVFKMKNDPRVTGIGKFLRKFSLDELPQLFNVFMGHMSLVGPRPPLPKEVKQYEPWQRRRLSMRPGITCLWQISGRNKIGFDEWMKLDLEYIDNWSLWLDFKILCKTVPAVLFGIGSY